MRLWQNRSIIQPRLISIGKTLTGTDVMTVRQEKRTKRKWRKFWPEENAGYNSQVLPTSPLVSSQMNFWVLAVLLHGSQKSNNSLQEMTRPCWWSYEARFQEDGQESRVLGSTERRRAHRSCLACRCCHISLKRLLQ